MNAPGKPQAHVGSVYDWHRLRYNYYMVPGYNSIGGWQPLTGLGIRAGGALDKGVGADIEDVLPVLPAASRFTGAGSQAVGRVYVLERTRRDALGNVVPEVPTQADASKFLQKLAGVDYGSLLIGFGLARFLAKWKVVTLVTLGYAGWKYLEKQQARGSDNP